MCRAFVRPAQLEVLTPQLADLLALPARETLARARVDLRLAHPPVQRLRVHPQVLRDVRYRAPGLERQPHTAITSSSGYFFGRDMDHGFLSRG